VKIKDLLRPNILLLSLFGAGLSPKAPGTVGTLLSIPILLAIGTLIEPRSVHYSILILTLTIIAAFLADHVQRHTKVHDPSWIVLDEFLGLALCWPFIDPTSVREIILIFVLFRFFDIVKIWPASFFDTHIKHGIGTIVDDLISGVYATCSFLVVKNFFF